MIWIINGKDLSLIIGVYGKDTQPVYSSGDVKNADSFENDQTTIQSQASTDAEKEEGDVPTIRIVQYRDSEKGVHGLWCLLWLQGRRSSL